MPLMHCNHCHHEFEGSTIDPCGWCNSPAHIIQEQTSFEKMLADKEFLDAIINSARSKRKS